MNKIREFTEPCINLLFPRRCPICDRAVKPFGALICDDCSDGVGYIGDNTCFKCGKQVDAESEYCEDCRRSGHVYERGMAVFDYKSVSASLYRFKYRGRREYAAWYAEEMAEHLGERIRTAAPSAFIPVPIHPSKMRRRGYNQASLIAHELSRITGIPVYDDLIRRVRKTVPLKDHTPSERNIILRGAFKLSVNDVELKTIMVIDDIYTTGATIDAVAAVFKQAGTGKVYFATPAIGKGV